MRLLARLRTLTAAFIAISLAACGGGGGSSAPPVPSPTSTPTPPPSSPYTCPSSDTSLNSSGARASGGVASETRRSYRGSTSTATLPLLAVSYRTSAITNPATSIDARVASLGATKYSEHTYSATGISTRLLHVAPSAMAQVESTLRSTPGVVAVGQSRRLAPLTVSSSYLGTDPYFVGYTAGGVAAPLYQTSSTGGQWDMHIVQLEHAFAYSQSGNTVAANPNALGSTSVKLAIIDSGEDVTHPELAKAHIVRTECYITSDTAPYPQSTGTYVTDGLGHGTDVTGIAVANANNDYGFVGDAGNVSLMLYRVFPTPDDNCTPGNSAGENDDQCGAADTDIISAIDDAVANGANVISMSLGGNNCTTPGVDPDPNEGAAIANAIANNVIVVAASGNGGGQGVTAPACDQSVIAVGASGYEDGQTNGTNPGTNTGSEYVTSYTQYGNVNVPDSIASWGIVAPGGDPSAAESSPNATTIDYLHWIENIWTSTPYMSSPSDQSFAGNCAASTEYGEQGNCRTLIAGTSMATPHVAGAAALILSVNPLYQPPALMKALLCDYADDIGDPHEGCGRLNVYRAMAKALTDPSPPT
ncbi:MAG: S8 family serine peptidase [Candidatus Aquilonibacter sp.]